MTRARKFISLKNMKNTWLLAWFLVAIATARAELISNPSFEDNNADGTVGDDWSSFGAQAFMDFYANGNPGHATFFADKESNVGGIFRQGISATAGQEYEFSIDAAFEANWSARVQFGMEFYVADDATSVGESLILIQAPLPDTTYHTYTMKAVAPVGTIYVRPIVRYDGVTDVQGSSEAAMFDNAHLNAVPRPDAL